MESRDRYLHGQEIQEAKIAGRKEVVKWIIAHKKGYYTKPDGTIISVTSAEWTAEEWQLLTKRVGL